jgi:hypothetical protein
MVLTVAGARIDALAFIGLGVMGEPKCSISSGCFSEFLNGPASRPCKERAAWPHQRGNEIEGEVNGEG